MNKLTDLELEKRIAEIDFSDKENLILSIDGCGDLEFRYSVSDGEVYGSYDPFDWVRLGPLMVKHDIDVIHYDDGGGLVLKGVFEFSFDDDDELPRAILECIEANNV